MGLNTLSESFSLGARSSSSGLTYSLQQSMAETYTIRSVTGGQYRSGTAQQDLVFLQENQSNSDNTDVHFRTFNTGAGTFNGSTVTTVNGVWQYTATADLNGDGYGDLIFLNPEYGSKFDQYTQEPESPPTLTIGVLMSNPGSSTPFAGGSLKTVTIDATGTTQDEVAMTDMDFADFNGDGIVDVIVAGVTAGKPLAEAPSSFNYVYTGAYTIGLGVGDGTFNFQPLAQMPMTYTGSDSDLALGRVAAMDFNNDGYVDIAFGFHLEDQDTLPENDFSWVIWGSASSSSSTPSFYMNTADSSSVVAVGQWANPQDFTGVWQTPSGGVSTPGNLGVTLNSSTWAALFDYDKSFFSNVEVNSHTPRGPFGPAYDYDGDGYIDLMFNDGNGSAILTGINWDYSDTSNTVQHQNMTLGTDIFSSGALDFNGDGKMDWAGGYNGDNHIYAYVNQTQFASDAAVQLVEGEAVAGVVNGVAAHRMMGSDFTLSVVGGRSACDNALGWFEIRADGSFGDARFLSVTGGTTEIDGLGAGSRLALFLVSNGAALNDDLTGSFRFVDAVSGGAAKIGSKAPALVSVDRAGQVVEGNIFHTADANSFDMLNALNPTGHHQTLSRMDASGDLLIAFEDTLLTDGDFDFNDLVVKVTVHEDAGLL